MPYMAKPCLAMRSVRIQHILQVYQRPRGISGDILEEYFLTILLERPKQFQLLTCTQLRSLSFNLALGFPSASKLTFF